MEFGSLFCQSVGWKNGEGCENGATKIDDVSINFTVGQIDFFFLQSDRKTSGKGVVGDRVSSVGRPAIFPANFADWEIA